ncbi:MAG: hypothetical protein H0X27_13030 [Caulobacteraceae bacterium]|nr:hypothetical protein [Caulobacteraceae bacterium]
MAHHPVTGALGAVVLLSVPGMALCAIQDSTATPAEPAPAVAGQGAGMDNGAPGGASRGAGGVVMEESQMPPGQVQALKNGDNTLIANAPVPDTADNRAKYGKPLSQGGKSTPPAGN